MNNKKYFHQEPDRTLQSDRVQLMDQGKLNEKALDFSYITNQDDFNKAIQWSLRIPKGGNRTTFKRKLGQLAGQTSSPMRGIGKSDLWSDRMAMTK